MSSGEELNEAKEAKPMAKRSTRWIGMAAALLVVATSAVAQGPQRLGPGHGANGDGPRRVMPADLRPAPALQSGAEPHDVEFRERDTRLSPEERRQLRRDVHEAGRDLYPGRMSPRRREAGRD